MPRRMPPARARSALRGGWSRRCMSPRPAALSRSPTPSPREKRIDQPPPAHCAGFPPPLVGRVPAAFSGGQVGALPVLAAGDGVAVAHALRQSALGPGLAAVARAEYLPDARDRVDLVWVFRVRHDSHHRRLGVDAMVEALPALANVVTAIHRAV